MNAFRHIKPFKNGRNQALRISRGFELPGEEDPIIHREGNKLIIKGAPPRSLFSILSKLTPIDEEFADIDDPPPAPEPEPVSDPGLES